MKSLLFSLLVLLFTTNFSVAQVGSANEVIEEEVMKFLVFPQDNPFKFLGIKLNKRGEKTLIGNASWNKVSTNLKGQSTYNVKMSALLTTEGLYLNDKVQMQNRFDFTVDDNTVISDFGMKIEFSITIKRRRVQVLEEDCAAGGLSIVFNRKNEVLEFETSCGAAVDMDSLLK